MFIEVVKAEYVDGYKVKLLFNNGETKIVDFASSLNGIVFAPLKDIEFFKRFTIKFNTIEWENGADFAPEYLYKIGTIYEEGNMIHEEENMNPHVITTEKIVHTIKDSHQKTKIEPTQFELALSYIR